MRQGRLARAADPCVRLQTRMRDCKPKKETKQQLKRIDGPPKPPTKVALDSDELGALPGGHPLEDLVALTHAHSTYFELMTLTGGGRRLKRESLELSLDRNIVLLGRVIPKLEGKLLEIVTGVLRDIRDYRREFPRTDASNQQQADHAQKILNEIPEV